jgi:hypothetical protein
MGWEGARLHDAECHEQVHVSYATSYAYHVIGDIMNDARERLTQYGVTLLLKHVQASTNYVIYLYRPDSPVLPSFFPLGDEVGDHVDMDLLDLPRYSTVREFCDSKGFDLRTATVFIVVTRHTINRGRVNPHFVLLCDKVQGRPCHQSFYCTCGSSTRCGVPCRHFWVVLLGSPLAGFHFGMVNELWFRAAQSMEASERLYAFDGCSRAESVAVSYTRKLYLNAPRHTSDDKDFGLSAIGKKREYGNLLGVAKKLIHTAVESGHTSQVLATLESLVSRLTMPDLVNEEGRSHRPSLIALNPHKAKPRGRRLGALNKVGQSRVVPSSQPESCAPAFGWATSVMPSESPSEGARPLLGNITISSANQEHCGVAPKRKRLTTCGGCGGEGHRRNSSRCPLVGSQPLIPSQDWGDDDVSLTCPPALN